jgi:hypothetical protein
MDGKIPITSKMPQGPGVAFRKFPKAFRFQKAFRFKNFQCPAASRF